jgi:hypothetical protein
MWKIPGLHFRKSGRGTLVFRMTRAASNALVLNQLRMQGGRISQLGGNILVTSHASITKSIHIPGSRVAFRAVVAYLGMRGNPTDIFSGLSIQTAGSEKAAAAH